MQTVLIISLQHKHVFMDIENFLIGSELKEVINLIMQNLGKTRATLLRQIRHAGGGCRHRSVKKRFREFPTHFHRSIRR